MLPFWQENLTSNSAFLSDGSLSRCKILPFYFVDPVWLVDPIIVYNSSEAKGSQKAAVDKGGGWSTHKMYSPGFAPASMTGMPSNLILSRVKLAPFCKCRRPIAVHLPNELKELGRRKLRVLQCNYFHFSTYVFGGPLSKAQLV
jgi:hypothetical protein